MKIKKNPPFPRKEIPFKEISDSIVDGKRFYHTEAGDFPSVTTVLGCKPSEYIEQWKENVGEEYAKWTVQEAGRRGSLFHNLVESYLKNEEVVLDSLLKRLHFMKAKEFFDKNFELIYANEIPLFSKKLRVAGRCDCVAKINGKNYIVDFKTAKRKKEHNEIYSYRIQASIYSLMLKEVYGLDVPNFCIIISDTDCNELSVYYGNRNDGNQIKDFIALRKFFLKQNNC